MEISKALLSGAELPWARTEDEERPRPTRHSFKFARKHVRLARAPSADAMSESNVRGMGAGGSGGGSGSESPPGGSPAKRGRSQSLAVASGAPPLFPGLCPTRSSVSQVPKNRRLINSIWNGWSQDQQVMGESRHASLEGLAGEEGGATAAEEGRAKSPRPPGRCGSERSPRRDRRMSLVDGFRSLRSENSFRRKTLGKRKTKKSRLVNKDGGCNVYNTNVPSKERNYIRDIFTTLIDTNWRWVLLALSCVFAVSWLSFALAYFLMALVHGDLDSGWSVGQAREEGQGRNGSDWKPCIAEINSFFSAFLFSVETQHTIGYGQRFVTDRCVPAAAAICLQSLVGLLIQSLMVGLVFAKIARPSKRAATLIFSERAVVSLQNGQLCLIIRVGDMRNTHLVEAHVRLQLIRQRVTAEGEVDPLHQFELNVGYDSGDDRIFLAWPMNICHVIDKDSPLFGYSAKDLPTAQWEIVVLLEGIVESTGMTAQARTSYLPSEVLWGHRFAKLVTYQKCNGSYKIDYGLFQSVYAVNTPRCSAKQFQQVRRQGLQPHAQYFHKTDQEARLEANHGEEGYTPIPSPLPSITPPSPIKEENVFFPEKGAKENGHAGGSGGEEKKARPLSLLRPPAFIHSRRLRSASPPGSSRLPLMLGGEEPSTTSTTASTSPCVSEAPSLAATPQIVINSPSSPSPDPRFARPPPSPAYAKPPPGALRSPHFVLNLDPDDDSDSTLVRLQESASNASDLSRLTETPNGDLCPV